MADAQVIIRNLGMQVAQLTVDKAILEAENEELRATLAGAGLHEIGDVEDRPAEEPGE
jgi:hypothetical protein